MSFSRILNHDTIPLSIKGKKLGSADIIVSWTYNGKAYTDSVRYNVIESLYSLYIDGDDEVDQGSTINLRAELSYGITAPMDITSDVQWTSSDPNIASVDNNGVVTGVREGNTIITAQAPEMYDSVSDFIEITVNRPAEKQITDIELGNMPSKLTYIRGYENLNLEGGTVKVKYDDNSIEYVPMSDSRVIVNGFDNTTVGENELTVIYQPFMSKTLRFTVHIVEKSVTNMIIEQEPRKKEYQKGEEIDLTGGIIKVTYNDNTEVYIYLPTPEVEVIGYDKNKVGEQEVLLIYGGKVVKYKVTVEEVSVVKDVDSISIKKLPNKVLYEIGETLELEGGIITVKYIDGTEEDIELPDYRVTVTGFTSDTAGIRTLTVNYKNKLAAFDVTIKAEKKIKNIELKTKPSKTQYEYGEEIDLSGGKIILTYDDGTEEEVDINSIDVKVSGYDPTVSGRQTVTLEYGGKTTNIDVVVNSKKTDAEQNENTNEGNNNSNNKENNKQSNADSDTKEEKEDKEDEDESTEENDDNEKDTSRSKKEKVDTGDDIIFKYISFVISILGLIVIKLIKNKKE